MAETRFYNEDALFETPLIVAASQAFFAALPAEFVAADVLVSYKGSRHAVAVAPASPACFLLSFDSMSEIPANGDVLDENGAGTATCTVMFTIVTAGTEGAGTAEGFMFVKGVSGQAWSDNDQIDNTTTGTADIATVNSTVGTVNTLSLATAAGLPGWGNNRAYVALTAAENQCTRGSIYIKDATVTEIFEDTALHFETIGRAQGVAAAGTTRTAAASSITLQTGHGLTSEDMPCTIVITDALAGAGQSRVGTSISSDVVTISPNWTTTPTQSIAKAIEYVVYITPPSTTAQEARLAELDAANIPADVDTLKTGVNATSISGDSTAADNLELMFDGTGYVGGTIKLGVDVVKLGGSAQSATDLKDFADEGYNPTIDSLTVSPSSRPSASGV